MKFRIGFVSNSSSSSFVLVAKMAAHNRAWAALDEEEQEALKDCIGFDKCFGEDVAVIAEVGDHGGSYISGADYDDQPWDALEKYKRAVGTDPSEVFTHAEDW